MVQHDRFRAVAAACHYWYDQSWYRGDGWAALARIALVCSQPGHESRRNTVQCRFFDLTVGQVGIGSAWKLCMCCAAATPVSGTRLASGLHPGTP